MVSCKGSKLKGKKSALAAGIEVASHPWILQLDAEDWLKGGQDITGTGQLHEPAGAVSGKGSVTYSESHIDELIAQRTQAKADKNWAEADRIRDALQGQGIVLEDAAGGTTWRRG